MEVLTRVRAGGREIHCGVATTAEERAAVLSQRFRVYQRRGYHRVGLQFERDVYDRRAIYFLAVLGDGLLSGLLLGSARLVLGESRAGFRLPAEKIFQLELPAKFQEIPVDERAEVQPARDRGGSGRAHRRLHDATGPRTGPDGVLEGAWHPTWPFDGEDAAPARAPRGGLAVSRSRPRAAQVSGGRSARGILPPPRPRDPCVLARRRAGPSRGASHRGAPGVRRRPFLAALSWPWPASRVKGGPEQETTPSIAGVPPGASSRPPRPRFTSGSGVASRSTASWRADACPPSGSPTRSGSTCATSTR
jgi:hypothetical protein